MSGKGGNKNHNTKPTSRFVQDYNMLQLTSISLSYDLPAELLEQVKLSMVRFEIGTDDLFHASTVEQERGTIYPFARSVNFSVKLAF